MSVGSSSTPERPPLSPEGIKRLSSQLDTDLAAMHPSVVELDLIQKTKSLVGSIKTQLAAPSPDWVAIGTSFATLLANLKAASTPGSDQTGACFYSNPVGCIQTTAQQCTALGGNFQVGKPCS